MVVFHCVWEPVLEKSQLKCFFEEKRTKIDRTTIGRRLDQNSFVTNKSNFLINQYFEQNTEKIDGSILF